MRFKMAGKFKTKQASSLRGYGAPLWTIFGEELLVRCWIVGTIVSTFDLRRSVFEDRWSKIDGRWSMVDAKIDDRWSKSNGRWSKIDDRWSKIDDR